MLKLSPTQLIQGLTVYGDDSDSTMFYVMPDQPSFRIDSNTGSRRSSSLST